MTGRRTASLAMAALISLLVGCGSTVQPSGTLTAPGGALGPDSSGLDATGSDELGDAGLGGAAVDSGSVSGGGSPAGLPGIDPLAGGGAPTRAGTPAAPGRAVDGAGAGAGATADRSPFRVGIVVVENNAAVAESFGLEGVSNGDEQANARAIVKAINADGGLGGRPIDPRYYVIRATDSSKSNGQLYAEICEHFTADDPVSVVLVTGVFEDSMWSCLSKKGILGIGQLAQYIGNVRTLAYNVISPSSVSVERQADLLARGLFDAGFYKGAAKLGIVSTDDEVFRPVVEKRLIPALEKLDVPMAEPAYLPPVRSAQDAASGAAGNAVLRFRSEGVDRVVFLQNSANGALMFMQQAESQGYRPRYGLTSAQYPTPLAANVPPAQLKDSIAASWVPSGDVAMKGAPVPPGRQRCLNALKTSGISYPAGTSPEVAALQQCDGLYLLASAARQGGAADATALRAGALALGTAWKPAVTVSGNLDPRRPDGAPTWHVARFDSSCTCYRADPQGRPIP
jgi:hypothetical protein